MSTFEELLDLCHASARRIIELRASLEHEMDAMRRLENERRNIPTPCETEVLISATADEGIPRLLVHPFQVNEIVVAGVVSDDGGWSYELHKVLHVNECGTLVCSMLWWDEDSSGEEAWIEYPDEPPVTVNSGVVVANRVQLTEGQISDELYEQLSSIADSYTT